MIGRVSMEMGMLLSIILITLKKKFKPALEKHGGKYLAGGGRVVAKENGVAERTILIEFESFEAAVAAFESNDYQAALKVLDGGADRDIRLFEGAQ